ncbi:uncharacterized protein E6C27_scaffold274G004630 [Cucumis melo var. makuwa]|uniref:Retrotransposon gag domain-containing protein n=1 Tax=Cucumis melo var. makuwa TaxID=1194695 RepID=A0A5A7USL5_CUCMM|nr:uncharacterized protein E6C27_scaffold274G004630 [Cucumis melo var. makuwa]
MGEVREKILRELAEPNEDHRPLCIVIPPTTQPFELKPGLIHLLPIFKGSSGEDPHKHLKDFHMVCDSMRPYSISEEQLNLRAFPFFLTDVAKIWLYYLEPGSITTWGSLKKKFLEKFFPASRANNIRKEIYGIRQAFGESLSKYWERFKELCASLPHYHIFDPSLIQYFYSGLLSFDRNTVDAATGGALADKTPTEARKLISRMMENSQSFGNRASELDNSLTKEVSELKSQMLNMTTLLTSFVQGTPLKVTKCGVCGLVGHPNDKCPEVIEDVNIVRRYDPHGTNLEDIIKALATNTLSFQQEMKQQMTQLTTAISKMDGKGKLPAQPDHANKRLKQTPHHLILKNDKSPLNDFTPYIPKPPFPSRLAQKKKETLKEEELLEMFRKVQINSPLLDAIQQVSRELNQKQEERLIKVLKKKKKAIGWTLDDIKGISPTFCMHRIILEEGAKEKIQPQRRLNPTLKEIVMKEVLKLKDAGIIYPVPDSTWVSPIHVAPKKIGMTIVKNDKGEMVSMRIQNGWRMCIDYRKLNEHVKTKRKQLLLVIMELMHLGVCHLVFVMHRAHSNVA